jgi:hypothetical protein
MRSGFVDSHQPFIDIQYFHDLNFPHDFNFYTEKYGFHTC